VKNTGVALLPRPPLPSACLLARILPYFVFSRLLPPIRTFSSIDLVLRVGFDREHEVGGQRLLDREGRGGEGDLPGGGEASFTTSSWCQWSEVSPSHVILLKR
jgi:hypothetical protein